MGFDLLPPDESCLFGELCLKFGDDRLRILKGDQVEQKTCHVTSQKTSKQENGCEFFSLLCTEHCVMANKAISERELSCSLHILNNHTCMHETP